jgi:hypothetical protein
MKLFQKIGLKITTGPRRLGHGGRLKVEPTGAMANEPHIWVANT